MSDIFVYIIFSNQYTNTKKMHYRRESKSVSNKEKGRLVKQYRNINFDKYSQKNRNMKLY